MNQVQVINTEKITLKTVYTCPFCGAKSLIDKEKLESVRPMFEGEVKIRCTWCDKSELLLNALNNDCLSQFANTVDIVRYYNYNE